MEFTRTELNFLVEFARAEILSLHDLSEKFTRAPTAMPLFLTAAPAGQPYSSKLTGLIRAVGKRKRGGF
jgi:hypothetical protein